MTEKHLIKIEDCCTYYNVEYSFMQLLHEHDLIEIIEEQNATYIDADALNNFEKLMHMHYDLDINLEGMEVINNLLMRVEQMHKQINALHTELNNYKSKEDF